MTKPILILDLGSTTARAFVISSTTFEILGSAKHEIKLIQSDDGTCEINANDLFSNILKVLRNALKVIDLDFISNRQLDAQVDAENILCLGMSVQRATFITIDKVTGEPFHHLTSWSDRRGNDMVDNFNSGCFLKSIHCGAAFLYWITRSERFKQVSKLKMLNNFIAPRLSHLMQTNRKLKEAVKSGRAAICTVDTWLLNRLKNFNKFEKFDFITDITNACATGLFDPFTLDYVSMNLKMIGIDRSVLPRIVDNSYDFGYTHKGVLGVPVHISTTIADQAASLIGNACFRKMDAKITLGTGTFLNINTGRKCMGSRTGAYPLIAWNTQTRKKQTSMVFYTERSFNDSTTLIRFAKTIGLCTNVEELSDMALSVNDSDGVMFIPKFHSLAGFIGYKQSTTKCHFVRAILESIVFKVANFYFLSKEDSSYHFDKIRIDGGISANDFICQSIADLLNIPIERGNNSSELTSIGCAFLAAYNCGVFDELENASKFYTVQKTFIPNEVNRKELFMRYKKFEELNSRYN